ncbi:zinc finger protein 25-like [Dunckerocampus dactyliophorus]|uniref:zinc finger protein 25-like n=1 Tax=Dunckerocampus dactyliophorus TaxID=161453 RepID=UPI002406CF18|nr:zinc finger protein 25-like [Dunckerocampus dactyliophorus]
MLKELVKERLMAAADEILALFESTIASYEEELSRTREENERHRQQLEAVSKTQTVLHIEDVQQLIGLQKERAPQLQGCISALKQEDPQRPHVKKEEEELWTTQGGNWLLRPDEVGLTMLPLTGVSVKTEDHEEKPPESSQLHHSPDEENKRAEPPSSSSSRHHLTTEADGDHCGGSQADSLLAPLSDSDDVMSHCHEDKDRGHTQDALSSDTDCEGDMRTPTDSKRSECSKKKTGKKHFTCSTCAKSFSSKSLLTRHMRTHTGEKPFSCSVCRQGFSQKSHMAVHMRTHTGKKPFNCSVCESKFAQKSTLMQHMRTHTGEKPFNCSFCESKFAQKSTLMQHMRTHTGEKPFRCSVCSQVFSDKSNMADHMRKHTGELW